MQNITNTVAMRSLKSQTSHRYRQLSDIGPYGCLISTRETYFLPYAELTNKHTRGPTSSFCTCRNRGYPSPHVEGGQPLTMMLARNWAVFDGVGVACRGGNWKPWRPTPNTQLYPSQICSAVASISWLARTRTFTTTPFSRRPKACDQYCAFWWLTRWYDMNWLAMVRFREL